MVNKKRIAQFTLLLVVIGGMFVFFSKDNLDLSSLNFGRSKGASVDAAQGEAKPKKNRPGDGGINAAKGEAKPIKYRADGGVVVKILDGEDFSIWNNAKNLMLYKGLSTFGDMYAVMLTGKKNDRGHFVLTGGKLVDKEGQVLFDITEEFLSMFDVQFARHASLSGEKREEEPEEERERY